MTNLIKLPGLAIATLAVIAATLSGIHSIPVPITVRRTATPITNAAFSTGESMREQFPKLPITFEENRGQTNTDVRYFAQGPHYAFFLTQNECGSRLPKLPTRESCLDCDSWERIRRPRLLGRNGHPAT